MRLPEKHNQKRPGAALVEMAFISLILFTFMFAIFEFGRYMMVRQIVENAARSGARQAVTTATSYIPAATATANVTATITQNLAAQNLKNLSIQIYQYDPVAKTTSAWTSATFGQDIIVQIDGDMPLLFPTFHFLPNNGAAVNSVHITTKVMMRAESN